MTNSSFMPGLGEPTTAPPSQARLQRGGLVYHNVSLEVIADLERRLAVPVQTEDGFLDWQVPAWLVLMRETARK